MEQKQTVTKTFKRVCHFKQVEDDSCFGFTFVNKVECQSCWKKFRFMEEYLPVKEEYEKRMKEAGKVNRSGLRRFMHWGGTIINDTDMKKID